MIVEKGDNFESRLDTILDYIAKDSRDCIFKGYVIPYLIDEINNKIILLGIVKYREEL